MSQRDYLWRAAQDALTCNPDACETGWFKNLRAALAEEAPAADDDEEPTDEERLLRWSREAPPPAAPQAAEPWGWEVTDSKGDPIVFSPIRNAGPMSKSQALNLAKEMGGECRSLYDRAPPAGGEEVRTLLEEVIEGIEGEGMDGWAKTIREKLAQLDARRAKGDK